jgi:hypothetical protein
VIYLESRALLYLVVINTKNLVLLFFETDISIDFETRSSRTMSTEKFKSITRIELHLNGFLVF